MERTDRTPEIFVPRPRRRPRWWLAIGPTLFLLCGVLVVVDNTIGQDDRAALTALQHSDPNGAKACTTLRDWLRGDVLDDAGRPQKPIIVGVTVAGWTSASTTPDIKAAYAGPVLDPQTLALLRQDGYTGGTMALTSLQTLYYGCDAAGLAMPPFTMEPRARPGPSRSSTIRD